jgi:hypothetical protein
MTFVEMVRSVAIWSAKMVWLLLLLIGMHPFLGAVAFAVAFALGAARQASWKAVGLAIGATTLNGTLVILGAALPDWGFIGVGLLLAAFSVICGAGWGLGRIASRLVSRQRHAQS